MEIINWANKNVGFSQLVSAVITMVITVIYIWFVKKQADAAKRQADIIFAQSLSKKHHDMIREVYGPVIEWLDKLNDKFILIKDFYRGRVPTWDEYKETMSPMIYQMNDTYMDKIGEINHLLKKFLDDMRESVGIANSIVEDVIISNKLISGHKLTNVTVFNPVVESWPDVFWVAFSENYLKTFIDKVKEKGEEEISLQLYTDSGVQGLRLSQTEFSQIAFQIRTRTMQNDNLSSKIVLYNKIRDESKLLLLNIEKEAKKSEADLVKEYGID